MQGPADSHTACAYPLLTAAAAPPTLLALVDAASAQAPAVRMRWFGSGRPRRCRPHSLLSSGGGGC